MTEPNANEIASKLKLKIEKLIESLIQIGQEFNPIDLLSHLAAASFHTPDGPMDAGAITEPELEYAQSLFLASEFPISANSEVPPECIQNTINTLRDLYQSAVFYYTLSCRVKEGHSNELELIIDQRLKTLHVRGDAYYDHIKQTCLDIIQPHADFLKSSLGFDGADVLNLTEFIEYSVQQQIKTIIAKFETTTGKRTGEKILSEDCLNLGALFEAIQDLGSPNIFQIRPRDEKDKNILSHISIQFGENQDFLNKIKNWRGWPLNPTVILRKPIVAHQGKFYLFHLPLLGRGILSILEALISETHQSYWQNTYLPKRDYYFETTAVELITGILKGCESHQNLFYDYTENDEIRRGELDGLVIYDDCLLIIEVKASGLSTAAKRGAPESIISDLKDSLDKAYTQATRVLTVMRSSEEVVFTHENGSVKLRMRYNDFRSVYIISVTRDLFSSLATNLNLVRDLGLIKGKEWPWSVCLNDLRIIAEIIDHPTLFLHYLNRRLKVNEYRALHVSDELDYFGHFLSEGLYFEEDKNVQKSTMVVLNGYSEIIDDYYSGLQSAKAVSKPKYPIPQRLEKLISMLETFQPIHYSSAVLSILAFDSKGLESLDNCIIQLEDKFKVGKGAIAVMANTENAGVAIILGCSMVGKQEEQTRQQAQLNKKKYHISKAFFIHWQPPIENGNARIYLL